MGWFRSWVPPVNRMNARLYFGETQTTVSDMDPQSAVPRVRSDRTHYLYLAVVVAVAGGIVLGLAAPDAAKALKPLGTGFVALIKMMI